MSGDSKTGSLVTDESSGQTAVIIPVRNEQQTIGDVLSTLYSQYDYEVIVADDASSDDSFAVARQSGACVLPLPINLGAWGAMQTGMRFALKRGFLRVVTMDGDGQHHCQEISRLVSAMNSSPEYDVIIGACVERGSKLRKWAWSFFRHLTGVGIEDITSGFRIYNRRAIEILVKRNATLLDYQDIGVLLLLQRAGLKVGEVNVTMSPRRSGKSHIYYSWFAVAYYMLFTTVLSLSKGKPLRIKTLNGSL